MKKDRGWKERRLSFHPLSSTRPTPEPLAPSACLSERGTGFAPSSPHTGCCSQKTRGLLNNRHHGGPGAPRAQEGWSFPCAPGPPWSFFLEWARIGKTVGQG